MYICICTYLYTYMYIHIYTYILYIFRGTVDIISIYRYTCKVYWITSLYIDVHVYNIDVWITSTPISTRLSRIYIIIFLIYLEPQLMSFISICLFTAIVDVIFIYRYTCKVYCTSSLYNDVHVYVYRCADDIYIFFHAVAPHI